MTKKHTIKLDNWQLTALQEAVAKSDFLAGLDQASVDGLRKALKMEVRS